MIGARIFLALSALSLLGAGCTAFVASQLSGDSSDGGTTQIGAGCFHITDNQCGECIASNCEDPNAKPPVSLAKVCSLASADPIMLSVQECTAAPGLDNYECGYMYADASTGYASTIDMLSAAVNNVQHCITDHCATSCSQCNVQVPTCGSDTVLLADAGACGQCIDQAINQTGGVCQSQALADTEFGSAACTEGADAISKCAIAPGQCQTPDCSGISSPTTTDSALQSLYSCLWQYCASSCE
ncbi:MAG TPA: hypothetical protein VGH28_05250 [Polyangiaceae bacterium]|jgi:hypothetical protein